MTEQQAIWRDAVRGAMWEDKYRGTLEEHPSPDMLEVSARKWAEYDASKATPLRTEQWPFDRAVGLGTYQWKGNPDVIAAAVGAGAAMIDTAEGYGFGKVEKNLGEALRRCGGPGATWIASKVARNHMTRNAVVSAGHRSRDALGVDCIDLYQIHWPVFSGGRMEGVVRGLAELAEKGVIRRVGVSNFSAGQLVAVQELAGRCGLSVVSNQVRLNRNDRSALEWLLPFCNRAGVRVIAYSPLAQGGDAARPAEALGWVLSHPVACVIPATNSVTHATANVGGGGKRKEPR